MSSNFIGVLGQNSPLHAQTTSTTLLQGQIGGPTPTGLVTSVFGRTGAVVAVTGDYTAAQVTNAVDQTQTYPNPAWITSLAWSKLTGVPSVLAGSGLSGGGPLTTNVTLSAVPMGASGASHAAGIVPDPGSSAGSTHFLCENATWVVPPGTGLTDPTTTLGDLIVRGAAAPPTRLGVGTNNQALIANSGATLGVNWAAIANSFNGRTGAVVPVATDYTPAFIGAVPTTTQVIAGTGLTGGGALSGNVTLNVANPTQWTSGSGGAIYYNGGNVGIGSSAPQQLLTLKSGSAAAIELAVPTSPAAALASGGTLTVGTAYYYVVTALDGAGGETVQSTQVTATPTSGNQTITVTWTAVTGAASYKVYRTTTSGSYGATSLAGNPTAASFSDNGVALTSGTPPTVTSADVVKINSAGNSWFNGGNVGIGTASPTVPLTFAATTGDKISLYGGTYGFGIGASLLAIFCDTSASRVGIGYGSSASFTERMSILGNGNVGIGTASPSEALTVAGAVRVTGGQATNAANEFTMDYSAAGRLLCNGPNTTSFSPIQFIQQHSDGSGAFNPIYINASGNVGMGTTSPGARLEVVGQITISSAVQQSSLSILGISSATDPGVSITCNATSGRSWQLLSSGGASSLGVGNFTIYDQSGGGPRFSITSGGNVGIGVTGPTHLLELNADSAAKPTSNTWTIFSDIRLKRNIHRFEGDMNVIRRLDPIVAEYNGLGGTPEGQRVVSLDAEKLREILPYCVSSTKGKLNPKNRKEKETDLLGVNTHEIFYHMLRAVQMLDVRLAKLEGAKQ